jgi:hypothetical protein
MVIAEHMASPSMDVREILSKQRSMLTVGSRLFPTLALAGSNFRAERGRRRRERQSQNGGG